MPFPLKPAVMLCAISALTALPHLPNRSDKQDAARRPPATFYRDILPILQRHCQSCHRAGSIAPMAFETYEQTRPFGTAIRQAVEAGSMPPWFADPAVGKFANDPSLSATEIATLAAWSQAGTPAGDKKDAPSSRAWAGAWSIPNPDRILTMPKAVPLPATGDIEYTYEIVPTRFAEDRWVQMAEVLPRLRSNVHHAVVYIRTPDSNWLRHAPVGIPFTAGTLAAPDASRSALWTDSDILLVYAPGSSPDQWPDGMAKFVPAGSDLVFQMHYTTNGTAAQDQTSIGLVFTKIPPKQRVITLQLNNHALIIPPGADDFRVQVQGSLPNDATLLSFFPHMHLRGKRFEYDIVDDNGSVEVLLRVNYHFHWQLSYKLAEPRLLKAGTKLRAIAWYDNSKNNPHNPDPTKTVTWGDQTSDEMMVGFFDVAVPAGMDKWKFFERKQSLPSKTD